MATVVTWQVHGHDIGQSATVHPTKAFNWVGQA